MLRTIEWSDLDKAVARCLLDYGVITICRDVRRRRIVVIDVVMLSRALYDERWAARYKGAS